MTKVEEVASVFRSYGYHFQREEDLQEAVAAILRAEGIPYEREKRLSAGDRVDFFLPLTGIGIEVKVDGPANAVARQLQRYARSDLVAGLVLVTGKMRHRQVPRELNGKEVAVVATVEASL